MLSVKRNFVRLAALALSVRASTLWSGSFSYYNTSSDFDKWSWSNEVGEYQWYIHGSGATSEYLNLDPSYKNPASTETHGLKLTIDNTAFWNGQTMQRTEIIPQTTANLGTGQTYYHFSLSPGAHYPDTTVEHQILFFESHFVQLKLGVSPTPTSLQFFAGSNAVWSTTFVTGTWYNFAYDINFSTGVVGLWASTGSNPLTNVVSGITGTGPSTNSEDFHVGVLAFGSATEDWLISGVYIESGTITTSIGSGSGTGTTTTVTSKSSTTTTTTSKSSTSTSTSKATTTTSTSTVKTTTTSTTTSSAAGATQTIYGQCGGIGYTGPTSCATGSTCTYSNAYYSQCLP